MKKLPPLLLAVLLVLAFPLSAVADSGHLPDFELTADAVYLYNLDTETLIFERNSDKPMYPASLTKIMTCILALETTENLDSEIVTYPMSIQNDLYLYQLEVGAVSSAGLLAGEELTMRECLYAMMLPSANEVALSVAAHIGGSQEAFAQMMNRRAKELGALNTNFLNPNGLFNQEHTTTAYDIFLLARHAMSLPGFMDIVNTPSYTMRPTNRHSDSMIWNTTNEMIAPNSGYYYPYASGIKTGTLPQAGRCYVSTATRDGFTYMVVLMGCDYQDAEGNTLPRQMAFDEATKLFNWVFSEFRLKTVINHETPVTEIPLRLSFEQDHVKLMSGKRLTALLPSDIDLSRIEMLPNIPDSLNAPVHKGDVVGDVALRLNGELLGTVSLQVAETVEGSTVLVLLDAVQTIVRSFWFKFAAVFFGILIVLYIILMVVRNRNRRRRGYKPRRRL
jgi:D-alanyl-D-alanine carboxypeptidase